MVVVKGCSIILVLLFDLFSDELATDKVLVDTVHRDELGVSATLLDLTVLHDDDLVSILDGAESVSDDDNSLLATVDQLVKSLLHLMLTLSIES